MKTTKLKRNILGFAALLILITSTATAQLASWDATGVFGYGPSPWAPTASSASMSVGGWTRGSGVGLTGISANNAWGGVNWTGGQNEDATFTITSNPGSIVSYSVFNLFYRRSNTGPGTGTLEYTFGNASTTYTVISPLTFVSATSGAAHAPINLSGIPNLQGVAPGTVVKFRILPTGGGAAGTWYVFGSGTSIEGSFSGFGMQINQTTPVSCNSQSTGVLTANVVGSTAPYTYSWMPSGGTASVAPGLAAGVYTCMVTSATSETTFATYTLTQPAPISGSVTAQTNAACHGGNNGAATVSVTGGTPGYTFSWSPMGGTATTGTNLTAGIYTLYITDSHNCPGTKTLSITEPASTINAYASNSVICNGGTVTANALGATTYTWAGGISNGIPFSPTATAVYTVYATNIMTGCTESNTLAIAVNPAPIISALSNYTAASLCSGANIILTALGANTYTWSGGVTDGTAFTPTTTATYTVRGTDINNCTGSAAITVTVMPNPSVTISSSKPYLCRTESATLSAGGALSYTWSTSASALTLTVAPITTTTYSLIGTDANGCVNTAAFTQSVSNCIGIETQNAEASIRLSVFPNPSTGSFMVKHTTDAELVIINALGQTIQTIQLNDSNNREQKIENLANGVYFIMSSNKRTAITQKVIVTR